MKRIIVGIWRDGQAWELKLSPDAVEQVQAKSRDEAEDAVTGWYPNASMVEAISEQQL